MDKASLLDLCASARDRIERADLRIQSQHTVIAALEAGGVDPTMAKAIFVKLIAAQDADLDEMEHLLDELDNTPARRQA